MEKTKTPLHIHIEMELNWQLNRNILEGIVEARTANDWNWIFTSRGTGTVLKDTVPGLPTMDGAIGIWPAASKYSPPIDPSVPMVHIGELAMETIPENVWYVSADNHAVGCMAGEYFLDKGFDSLAYIEYRYKPSTTQRLLGFRETVEGQAILHQARLYGDDAVNLEEFLAELPIGTGIFCPNDAVARAVCTLLYLQGRKVPEELAVLGVDDDIIQCSLSPVPLSSVDIRTRDIGRKAAEILSRVLQGEDVPRSNYLEPAGIKERRSSDLLAITDPKLAVVLRRIRERACEGVRVADILQPRDGARRTIEKKFQILLGRSIEDEIRRCRMETARQMLLTTSQSVEYVSDKCGFVSLAHFSRLFKKHFGQSPSQFRKQRV